MIYDSRAAIILCRNQFKEWIFIEVSGVKFSANKWTDRTVPLPWSLTNFLLLLTTKNVRSTEVNQAHVLSLYGKFYFLILHKSIWSTLLTFIFAVYHDIIVHSIWKDNYFCQEMQKYPKDMVISVKRVTLLQGQRSSILLFTYNILWK